MRKVLFLMLLFVVFGAVNINSQVRIGGDGEPHTAAVLDLNADDATDTGTKGLALPRVQLESDDAKLDGVTDNLDGMLIYNTGGTLSAGVYFWNGTNWIMGLTDTIPNGGLTKTGDGNVGIKTGGVTTAMIANAAVTEDKLAKYVRIFRADCSACATLTVGAYTSYTYAELGLPSGCGQYTIWIQPTASAGNYQFSMNSTRVYVTKIIASSEIPFFTVYCYK